MENRHANSKHTNRTVYVSIIIISIICLILSVVIYLEKTQYSLNHNSICSAITGSNGCEVVQASKYGKTLGVDNPIYGILGFILLGILAAISIYRTKRIITNLTIAGGIIAGVVAIIFLYLQAFVIHTYCLFCVIVDISSLALLGISLYLLYAMHTRTSHTDTLKHK
jgi:uncharacterized membrane protein